MEYFEICFLAKFVIKSLLHNYSFSNDTARVYFSLTHIILQQLQFAPVYLTLFRFAPRVFSFQDLAQRSKPYVEYTYSLSKREDKRPMQLQTELLFRCGVCHITYFSSSETNQVQLFLLWRCGGGEVVIRLPRETQHKPNI